MVLEEKFLRESYELHQIRLSFRIDFPTYCRNFEDEYLKLREQSGLKEEEIHARDVVNIVIAKYKKNTPEKSSK